MPRGKMYYVLCLFLRNLGVFSRTLHPSAVLITTTDI